eukprot:CAMPEP_0197518316 /NCGR_PEP_ID=MMETSP1318-20131121/3488_1 /TAXON_ID=552666 /ORGANISM="Partenskyella glossopodia, Strain RCC365" /LENGTH=351 /DNA_ID=CAMNT_0043068559 /DNA_START=24 /DNA_END=1079 /DNA_ORIENTATION=-
MDKDRVLIAKYYNKLMQIHERCRSVPELVLQWSVSSLQQIATPKASRLFFSVDLGSLPGGARAPPAVPFPPSESPLASPEDDAAGAAALRFGLRRDDPAGGLLKRLITGWLPVSYLENDKDAVWSEKATAVPLSVLVQPNLFRFDSQQLGREMLRLGFFQGVVLSCLSESSEYQQQHVDNRQGERRTRLSAAGIFIAASAGDQKALRALLYKTVGNDKRLWTFTLRIVYVLGSTNLKRGYKSAVSLSEVLVELARLQGAHVAVEFLRDSLGSSPGIDRVLMERDFGSLPQHVIQTPIRIKAHRVAHPYLSMLQVERMRRSQHQLANELAARLEMQDQGVFRQLFQAAADSS